MRYGTRDDPPWMGPNAPATPQFVTDLHNVHETIIQAIEAEEERDGRIFDFASRTAIRPVPVIHNLQLLSWAQQFTQHPIEQPADQIAVLLEIAQMAVMAAADAAQGKDLTSDFLQEEN